MLLRNFDRSRYSEFLEIWKESIPSGMNIDEKFLKVSFLYGELKNFFIIFLVVLL